MNIFHLWKKKYDARSDISTLMTWNTNLSENIITLARLMFIAPEALIRESHNTKANAEYILKLVECMKKGEPYENKRPDVQSKKRTA